MPTLTDLDTRCTLTELPAPTCAHCLHLPDPNIYYSYAKREGLCRGCGEPIYPGDAIHRPMESHSGWWGECCD
jgi:hypothetical protein